MMVKRKRYLMDRTQKSLWLKGVLYGSPLQGLITFFSPYPGALRRAVMGHPFGVKDGTNQPVSIAVNQRDFILKMS
jgi:hypothetical protein